MENQAGDNLFIQFNTFSKKLLNSNPRLSKCFIILSRIGFKSKSKNSCPFDVDGTLTKQRGKMERSKMTDVLQKLKKMCLNWLDYRL
jgi:hypothetical protein